MNILWSNQKMGDTWEQEGKPNPNPHVYNNFGGSMFALGWALYWIGLCGTNPGEGWDGSGLPIYFDLKTLLVFACGVGMVPMVLFVDFAHGDEGADRIHWLALVQMAISLDEPLSLPFPSCFHGQALVPLLWSILVVLLRLRYGPSLPLVSRKWIDAGLLIQTASLVRR